MPGIPPWFIPSICEPSGIVWPPPKGQERSLPFMAMVNAERDGLPNNKRDYHNEVNGIMVGYQGHVPRARDKVGAALGEFFGDLV